MLHHDQPEALARLIEELVRLSDTYTVALNQQAADAAVLQEQAWLRTGQTQLAEHMIGQQVLGNLGRSVLDFLARYLRFEVGAAYLREDNGSLRRIASYGFSQQADEAEQTFAGNESLVAQAALENRVLQLDDLPAGYLKVSSGLGDAAPRHVLIVPVVHEGLVNGVVELGFLRELSPRDIEFYRKRLQDVLEETQQLNEELQVQQEELRTANEELEEQSRALKESQATWKASRPSWNRPTCSSASRPTGWTSATLRLAQTRWRSAPPNCSAPAATSRSSWPTCRTSCARR
jgi:hypothetical protein